MGNLRVGMQVHLMWAVVDSEGRITLRFSDMFSIPMGSSIFDTRREARAHAEAHGGSVIRIVVRPVDESKELFNYDSL